MNQIKTMTQKKPLLIYNTLKREKQVFVPQDPGRVTLYVCGPTVYSYAHIGNNLSNVSAAILYWKFYRRQTNVVCQDIRQSNSR